MASLTSVIDVLPAVNESVDDVPLPVNAGPFPSARSMVRLSIPMSAVVEEKPLPPLLKLILVQWQ